MINQTITLISVIFMVVGVNAQELLSPSFTFSHKKTAYLTLIDGTELNGNIKDIDREKGLIEEIKIIDGKGKKHKLKPEEVKFMYLPPSGLDKLSKATSFVTDAKKWNNEKLNQDFLSQGYIYFELADVKVKKKELKLLMQLLNPDFSSEMKVYHDPYAKETMSLGIGSVDLVGGIAKSYYLTKGDKPAFRLKKKNYDEEFTAFWSSCDKVITDYPEKKWRDLTKHIIAYSECQE